MMGLQAVAWYFEFVRMSVFRHGAAGGQGSRPHRAVGELQHQMMGLQAVAWYFEFVRMSGFRHGAAGGQGSKPHRTVGECWRTCWWMCWLLLWHRVASVG
jgi:hypothetical protein